MFLAYSKPRLLSGWAILLLSTDAVLFLPAVSHAQQATLLPPVEVEVKPLGACHTLESNEADTSRAAGQADTAALLASIPGVALSTGGGISSLPILHGLNDDRNRTLVDGVPLTASCPNHMNPALSYVAPAQVGSVAVVAGIAPVSAGGDSIGGTITVDRAPPRFAEPDEGVAGHGSLTASYRSNAHQMGVAGNATVANDWISLGYDGSWTRARDGRDGNGDAILASAFETQSHNLTAALRSGDNQVILRAGRAMTPYEGFPNQRMDLLGNSSLYLNAAYKGSFTWGTIDGRVYWQNVKHFMDFLADRNAMMPMPMNTDGTDAGYSLKIERPIGQRDILRFGNEYHVYRLNDWWSPVAGGFPSMGNGTFLNVDEGRRAVLGTYAEWEHGWGESWSGLLGGRNDTVWMNTGAVAGYSNCNSGSMSMSGMSPMGSISSGCSMMAGSLNYARDAALFNSRSHARTDANIDVTATLRYDASPTNTEEFGLARKSRSPSLYERYTWSTGTMASSMVNWLGNGTDYVGNLGLKPEIADKISVTAAWHGVEQESWSVKVTPYFSYVENYIGVDLLQVNLSPGIDQVQFANHDTRIYGLDLSGNTTLIEKSALGSIALSGMAGFTKGQQINNGNSPYHMQPLSARLDLSQRLGGLSNQLTVRLVAAKNVVNPLQDEQMTPGFAILDWRGTYDFGMVSVTFGVDNLLDRQYYDPNGGAYVSGWSVRGRSGAMPALPALGRSYNVGATVTF